MAPQKVIIGAKAETASNPDSTCSLTKSEGSKAGKLGAKFHKIILQLQSSSSLGASKAAKVTFKYSTKFNIKWLSAYGVLGTRTWGSRMVGTVESTKLGVMAHPVDCCLSLIDCLPKFNFTIPKRKVNLAKTPSGANSCRQVTTWR